MGKYKQWLHHQEIGRRLRDQINTLEQERARVQKMAPAHPTSLPELENPIISALLSFTRAGNKLSNIDPIKAAMPDIGMDPDQRKPASSAVAAASVVTSATNEAVVASLLARAEQMPSDPVDQMREFSRVHEETAPLGTVPAKPAPAAESVGSWWQRQQHDDE